MYPSYGSSDDHEAAHRLVLAHLAIFKATDGLDLFAYTWWREWTDARSVRPAGSRLLREAVAGVLTFVSVHCDGVQLLSMPPCSPPAAALRRRRWRDRGEETRLRRRPPPNRAALAAPCHLLSVVSQSFPVERFLSLASLSSVNEIVQKAARRAICYSARPPPAAHCLSPPVADPVCAPPQQHAL